MSFLISWAEWSPYPGRTAEKKFTDCHTLPSSSSTSGGSVTSPWLFHTSPSLELSHHHLPDPGFHFFQPIILQPRWASLPTEVFFKHIPKENGERRLQDKCVQEILHVSFSSWSRLINTGTHGTSRYSREGRGLFNYWIWDSPSQWPQGNFSHNTYEYHCSFLLPTHNLYLFLCYFSP